MSKRKTTVTTYTSAMLEGGSQDHETFEFTFSEPQGNQCVLALSIWEAKELYDLLGEMFDTYKALNERRLRQSKKVAKRRRPR